MRRSKITTQQIIQDFQQIHGDTYDYSKVEYNTMHKKVIIICQEHGEFLQTPNAHIRQKQGCNKCCINNRTQNQKDTTESFINKSKQIHGNRYDYTLTEYGSNAHDKVKIICKEHGVFEQTPNAHLCKKGCMLCVRKVCKNQKVLKLTLLEKFIINASKLHNNKYDYSKFLVQNAKQKGIIICPTHGEFLMNINNHISGKQKCKKCIEKKSCYYNIITAEKNKTIWSSISAILYVVILTDGVNEWLKIGVSKRKLSNRPFVDWEIVEEILKIRKIIK